MVDEEDRRESVFFRWVNELRTRPVDAKPDFHSGPGDEDWTGRDLKLSIHGVAETIGQLAERFGLDLTNAFAGEPKLFADFFERVRIGFV